MKTIFKKLYSLKTLNKLESYNLFNSIINNEINTVELTSVLISMKIRKSSIIEIIGAIEAFQDSVLYFPKPDYKFADITGTGGDRFNAINISTLSAIVASSFGLKIIKHCNQGISSNLGSSDILEKMNINIHINPTQSREMLDKFNICFLDARKYHSGFNNISKIRSQLKTKTIFNILGPLLNPAKPNISVVGVYSKKLLLPVAKILNTLNYKRAIIMHSDGVDEVTLHTSTDILEIYRGKINSYKLYPEDFGVKRVDKLFFLNNTIEKNYNIFKNVCKGVGAIEYQYLIAINTAILLRVFGYENLQENTKIVFEKIRSGDVMKHVHNLRKQDIYEK